MIVILSVLYCLLLYCQISVCFIVIRTPSPSIRAITSTARGRENNRLLISCTQLHTMTDSALPNDQDKSNTASNKAGIHYSIGQSAKYVVSAAVSAVLLTSTSPLPVYYTVAAVINSVFGKILKRIIRQPRPLLSPKKGNGMPSSHTSAISFFALALYYKSPSFITDIRIQRLVNFSTFGYALLAW